MNFDPKKFISLIEANPNATLEEFIILMENAISAELPFNHEIKNSAKASGVNVEKMESRGCFAIDLGSKKSELTESFEKIFSKRELALMLAGALEEVERLESLIDSLGVFGVMLRQCYNNKREGWIKGASH